MAHIAASLIVATFWWAEVSFFAVCAYLWVKNVCVLQ